MYTKLSAPRDLSTVITLDDAKHQLNLIGTSHDDTYVTALIPVAAELTESQTNNLLVDGTVTCSFNIEQDGKSQFLPVIPLPTTLTSVQIDGVDVDYSYNALSGVVTISTATEGDVVITYDVTANTGPSVLIHAMKILLSDLYENRGSQVDDQTYNVPSSFKNIVRSVMWRGV